MNERIKELAEQALNEYSATYHNEAKIPEAYLEKFAELIVEEVYDYILNATFDDEPWPSRKEVKEHFGVKE
jgi:hypothetical protein